MLLFLDRCSYFIALHERGFSPRLASLILLHSLKVKHSDQQTVQGNERDEVIYRGSKITAEIRSYGLS